LSQIINLHVHYGSSFIPTKYEQILIFKQQSPKSEIQKQKNQRLFFKSAEQAAVGRACLLF